MAKKDFGSAFKSGQSGFSLTEIAIVIGITGIVLGAVWTAASNVYAAKKINQATVDTMFIIQGFRSLYNTVMVTSAVDGVDETTNLENAAIFPADMATQNPPVTAWGDTTTAMVTSQSQTTSAANTGDAFEIEYNDVPTSGCVGLLLALVAANSSSGLFYLNATASPQGAKSLRGQTTIAFPVVVGDVNNACASGRTVSVQVAFTLK